MIFGVGRANVRGTNVGHVNKVGSTAHSGPRNILNPNLGCLAELVCGRRLPSLYPAGGNRWQVVLCFLIVIMQPIARSAA